MGVVNRPYAYSKMDNEDGEEMKHRRAQFLIYKAMQKADDVRRRPSWLRVKMFKLKIKIGKRFKKLKRGFFSAPKPHFYNQIACLFKSCKHFLHGKHHPAGGRALRPIF
ncbi:hypothetical protein C2S51_005486 [Perilla frutescens var. frutescens]|nr:hypothetical protein C2S51_005486 [Perilla frutescens var. frutescens]